MRRIALLFLLAFTAVAEEIYDSPEHPYSIAYDPAVWTLAGPEAGIDLLLVHRSGKADAAVYVHEEELTLDTLRASALETGKAIAPDLRVVSETRTKKDGAELLMMHTAGTSRQGPVAYRGVYWTGPRQYVQVIATTTNDTDADVRKLLDGLRIYIDKPLPARPYTIDFTPLKWRVTDAGSKDGVMKLQHKADDAVVLARAIRTRVRHGGMRAFALEQAKSLAPEVRVVSEQQKKVHGSDITVLQFEGTTGDGVPSVLYGYFFSGSGAYVHALTVTPAQRFQQRKGDLTELLEGLQIHIGRE